MPIKFRCQHCRQFLGISRSKAGAVVDCPTCGRALRVPHLDGTIEPLPEPGMDPMDSRLSQALDELAQIGEAGWVAEREARKRSAAMVTQEEGSPLELPPLPQPVPIEPPTAPEPVSAAAGVKIKPLPARRSVSRAAPVPQDESDEAVHPIVERARRPATLSQADPPAVPAPGVAAPEPSASRQTWSGWWQRLPPRTALVAALCGVGTVALAAGFLLGRAGRDSDPRADRPGAVPAAGRPVTATATEQALSRQTAALSGRITFESAAGVLEPDVGARIIAAPVGSPPGEKLPAEVLLDDERQADAAAKLTSLGGGFAVANGDGTFALALPRAGTYRVLVVSARQPRAEAAALDSDIEDLLRDWLDRPAVISDRRACLVREVRYSGADGVPFDCVFERPR